MTQAKHVTIESKEHKNLVLWCKKHGYKMRHVTSVAIREYLERQKETERIERRAKEIREAQSD